MDEGWGGGGRVLEVIEGCWRDLEEVMVCRWELVDGWGWLQWRRLVEGWWRAMEGCDGWVVLDDARVQGGRQGIARQGGGEKGGPGDAPPPLSGLRFRGTKKYFGNQQLVSDQEHFLYQQKAKQKNGHFAYSNTAKRPFCCRKDEFQLL